jgi:tetratricopeptide (TPR) repeat protein
MQRNKRLLFYAAFFFIGLWLSQSLKANDNEIFEAANKAYKEGNYSAAINEYNQLVNSNLESPTLYFNLGNAYFKNKQYTLSRYWFEKAHLLDPSDESIAFNLTLVQNMVGDKTEEIKPIFIKQWFLDVSDLFSSTGWAIISIISFALTFLLIGLFLLSPSAQIKKISLFLVFISFLISLISISSTLYQVAQIKNSDYAIIANPRVNIKSSPSEQGTDVFELHEGTKVKLIDKVGEWIEIQLTDGNKGWIKEPELLKL